MRSFIVTVLCLMLLVIGIMLGARITEARFEKELESVDVYPTGSFTLTFSVNEDAVDLEGKEALIDLMEQFSGDLAETTAAYRSDGNVEHIKLFKARIKGDRQTEALLRMWLKDRVSAKPSKGD